MVQVDDFQIVPAGNVLLFGGRVELHVKALVGAGYNSNVRGTAAGSPDSYGRGMAGLTGRYLPSPDGTVGYDLEVERIGYARNTGSDLLAGRVRIDGEWTGRLRQVTTRGEVQRSDDPLFETGERILHQDYRGAASARALDTVMPWELGAQVDRRDFLRDSRLFDDKAADHTAVGVSLRLGRLGAREGETYVRVVGINDDFDSGRLYNDHQELIAALGRRAPLGGRSVAVLEGGIDARFFTDDFNHDPAYGDSRVLAPYVSASASWGWEEGSWLRGGAFSRLADSYFSNATWNYGLDASLRCRLLIASYVYAGGTLQRARSSGAAAGREPQERTNLSGEAGLVYAMRDGLAVRVGVGATRNIAQQGAGFDRLVAAIDLAAAY